MFRNRSLQPSSTCGRERKFRESTRRRGSPSAASSPTSAWSPRNSSPSSETTSSAATFSKAKSTTRPKPPSPNSNAAHNAPRPKPPNPPTNPSCPKRKRRKHHKAYVPSSGGNSGVMARKPEKDSGCVGCAVLLAVGTLALVLWNLFHLRWWVALAVALLGPVLFLAVIETARERPKRPHAKRRRKVPEPESPPSNSR